jgi:CBS domain-containing protein
MSETNTPSSQRRVADVMTTQVISVRPETKVSEVARLMAKHHLSGLPVVDDQHHVVGVVTELDMMVRNTHFKWPNFIFIFDAMIPLELPGHYRERVEKVLGTTAAEVMSEPAVTIAPDALIDELAELMVNRRMNPIPVVADDRLVGIVSRADIIRVMAQEFGSSKAE